jgi:hypothetical protein
MITWRPFIAWMYSGSSISSMAIDGLGSKRS